MKFAFKKVTNPDVDFFEKLISWWENGQYVHVEAILAYDEQTQLYSVASSVPGVGMRRTEMVLPEDTWDIIEAPGNEAEAEAWFDTRLGCGYDWLGILGFIFRPIKGNPTKRWFCSEAVLESIGYSDPWRFDPNSAYDVLIARQTSTEGK